MSVSTLSPDARAASGDGTPAPAFEPVAAALASVGIGLWELDVAQRTLRLNGPAATTFQTAADQPVPLAEAVAKIRSAERDPFLQALDRLVTEGTALDCELPVVGADRSVRWSQIRGARLSSNPPVLRGTVHDITRLCEHDAVASEGAERYRHLVERTHELVAELTPEGVFCYVNPANETILGLKPEDVVGTSAFDLIHPEDLPRIQAHFQGDYGYDIYRFRHKDGSWRWLESTGSRFRTSTGEERGVVISRDVTERRLAEEEKARLEAHLRHAQKMEAIGTLAGGIAHDFNNILGVIIAYTELSKMDLPTDHPVQHNLSQVMSASDRAKGLVQQILAFSRQQRMDRKPMRLDAPVNDALLMFRSAQKRELALEAHLETDTPSVLADCGQIRQVVLNLCSNAALALPPQGGRIDVTLDRVDGRTESHRGLGPLDYARITVQDSGCGMDAETTKRIFDPFFTTRTEGEGVGLGLSVVHGVVKSHGGCVRVESAPGRGSRFEVYLPRFSGTSA